MRWNIESGMRAMALAAAMLLGAAIGYAQNCPGQGGKGNNVACRNGGGCGSIGGGGWNFPFFCIVETCSIDGGVECWPQNYAGCVLLGCADFLVGNCGGCIPTDGGRQ